MKNTERERERERFTARYALLETIEESNLNK